jgi:hypothetical protein
MTKKKARKPQKTKASEDKRRLIARAFSSRSRKPAKVSLPEAPWENKKCTS